jgi:tetratricopeptide (TPR) repeat protein
MKRKEALICLGLLLVFVFCFSCSNKKELADQHYKAGLELSRKGETEAALAEYRLAMEAYPKHIQANTNYQNYMLYTLNKEDEVFEEYAAKVKKHPRDPVYRYLYVRMGDDPDKMAEEAQSIIESNPKFYWGYYLLGSAYRSMNYDDDAIEAFEKAIEVDNTEIGAYSSLASLHATKGDLDKANEWYRKVLEIDSTQIWYHTYIWRNEYNEAEDKEAAKGRILAELDAVLAKNPDNMSFMSSLKYTLESMGESDRAREIEAKAIALDSTGSYAAMAAYTQIWQKFTDKEREKAAEEFVICDGMYSGCSSCLRVIIQKQRMQRKKRSSGDGWKSFRTMPVPTIPLPGIIICRIRRPMPRQWK